MRRRRRRRSGLGRMPARPDVARGGRHGHARGAPAQRGTARDRPGPERGRTHAPQGAPARCGRDAPLYALIIFFFGSIEMCGVCSASWIRYGVFRTIGSTGPGRRRGPDRSRHGSRLPTTALRLCCKGAPASRDSILYYTRHARAPTVHRARGGRPRRAEQRPAEQRPASTALHRTRLAPHRPVRGLPATGRALRVLGTSRLVCAVRTRKPRPCARHTVAIAHIFCSIELLVWPPSAPLSSRPSPLHPLPADLRHRPPICACAARKPQTLCCAAEACLPGTSIAGEAQRPSPPVGVEAECPELLTTRAEVVC